MADGPGVVLEPVPALAPTWQMWIVIVALWALTVLQDRVGTGSPSKWWFITMTTLYLVMATWRRPLPTSTALGLVMILGLVALAYLSSNSPNAHSPALYYLVVLLVSFVVCYVRHYVPRALRT